MDIAKSFDYTDIVGLDEDNRVCYHENFQSHSYTIIQERVKKLPSDVPVWIDVTGVGIGIYDNIVFNEKGIKIRHNIHKFLFTNESKNKIFQQLIKNVEDGTISYNQFIADQMTTIVMGYSPSGKTTFKAMGQFKDDAVMALAIANYKASRINAYQDWDVDII